GCENDARSQDEIGKCRLLAIAKGVLAFDFEDCRDRDAKTGFELSVRIDEDEAKPSREHPAERRFACARKSNQIEIAALKLHRSIVEDSLPRPGIPAQLPNTRG